VSPPNAAQGGMQPMTWPPETACMALGQTIGLVQVPW